MINEEIRSIEVEQFGFRDRSGIKMIFDNINVSIHFYMLGSTHALSLLTLVTTLRSWDFCSCAADEDIESPRVKYQSNSCSNNYILMHINAVNTIEISIVVSIILLYRWEY